MSESFTNIKSTTEMQVEKSSLIVEALKKIHDMEDTVKKESGNIQHDSVLIDKTELSDQFTVSKKRHAPRYALKGGISLEGFEGEGTLINISISGGFFT